MKRILMSAGIAIGTLSVFELIVFGARGGIGPLKFLHDAKKAKLAGNDEKYHLENVHALKNSPLKGKRILFLGSSVTYGAASLHVSMADYIGKLDGCDIVKEALSGTTLADKNRFSYVSRLKKVRSDQKFDAVVCQLSTNDASQKVSLGSVSASKDPADFDAKTVAGAIETIIAYCYRTWHCPVVFYTGTKYSSERYAAMVGMMPALVKKWGITVLDLWNDQTMNAVSKEDYALYMDDPVHPTQAGYLLWWTPKFEKCLYELLGWFFIGSVKNGLTDALFVGKVFSWQNISILF